MSFEKLGWHSFSLNISLYIELSLSAWLILKALTHVKKNSVSETDKLGLETESSCLKGEARALKKLRLAFIGLVCPLFFKGKPVKKERLRLNCCCPIFFQSSWIPPFALSSVSENGNLKQKNSSQFFGCRRLFRSGDFVISWQKSLKRWKRFLKRFRRICSDLRSWATTLPGWGKSTFAELQLQWVLLFPCLSLA